MTKPLITKRASGGPRGNSSQGVVRFDGNVQRASTNQFSPRLQPIRFTPGGEYLAELNTIANVGEGIFNATSRAVVASQRAQVAERDSYLAGVKADDIVESNRIYNENKLVDGNDPEKLAKKLEGYRNGKMANMPQDIQPFYKQEFDTRAATYVAKSQDAFYNKAQSDAKASLQADLEIIQDDIFKNPMPITDIENELYQSKLTSYRSVQQSRIANGFITPEEAALEEKDFRRNILTAAYKTHLDSVPAEQRSKEILKFYKNKTLPEGLDKEDKEIIVAKLNAYDATVSSLEVRATAQERARQDAVRAEQAADLEIRVNRSEATYEDVLEAQHKGLITPAKKVSLYKTLDSNRDKVTKDALSLRKVFGAVNGTDFIDPKSTEDKKSVDLAYSKVLLPQLDEAPTPAVKKSIITNFVRSTGIVPETLRGEMRGVFRGNNVEQKVFYADLVGRIRETKPQALDDFDDKDITQALMIDEIVKAGTSNELAVEEVTKVMEAADNRVEILNKQLDNYWSDIGNTQAQSDKIVDIVAGHFDKGWLEGDANLPEIGRIPFFKTKLTQLGVESGITVDYKNAYKIYYLSSNGDHRIAQQEALRSIERDWGTTEINGTSKQLTKFPIEKQYAILDAGGNNSGPTADEIKDELKAELKKALPEFIKGKSKKDIFLTWDLDTAREVKSGQRPLYTVYVKGSDDKLRLPPDPRFIRWGFDLEKYKKEKLPFKLNMLEGKRLEKELKSPNPLLNKYAF